MRRLLLSTTFLLLGLAALPALAQTAAPPPPIEAFARLPAAENPQVSPDGRHLAFMAEKDGRRVVVVKSLLAGDTAAKDSFIAPPDQDVRWFRWAKPGRLILSVRGIDKDVKRRVVSSEQLQAERRLLSVDLDGGNIREIGRRKLAGRSWETTVSDLVISTLPNDPDNILMLTQDDAASYASVAKVNLSTGARETLERSRPYVFSWFGTADGQIRSGLKIRDSVFTIIARDSKGEWVDIYSYNEQDGHRFQVVAAAPDPDILYVASRHEGDRWAIYEFSISRRDFGRTIASDPRFDISTLTILDGIPAGIWIDGDLPEQRLFAAEDQQLLDAIDKAMPGTREIMTSRSRDGRYLILTSNGPAQAPRYSLFDSQERKLTPLGDAYPELTGQVLGRRAYTAYPARDGTPIPAIITLPPGRSPQKLPFIVLPHGGPAARDDLSFHWMAQFLASRGYGVIQPNFRGSTGYGLAHERAGKGQWGRLMQDDLVDAVRFLTDQGLADPERVCMVGASYGGYAALVAGWRDPGLFRCAVSIAGLSDLTRLFDLAARSERRDANRESLGESREALKDVSPINMASRFTIPVLLIHGEEDTVAAADHSRDMAAALRAAGKPVEYDEIEGGDHYLSATADRIRVLTRLESFLARELGGPP